VLLEALWSGQRLKFLYDRSDGESSEREVDPLGLVARANRWYLVATRADEHRTYRVSRIRSPRRSWRKRAVDRRTSILRRIGKPRRIASASTFRVTTRRF
jgi:predicted DNA-binding transcriptional regulator YafY